MTIITIKFYTKKQGKKKTKVWKNHTLSVSLCYTWLENSNFKENDMNFTKKEKKKKIQVSKISFINLNFSEKVVLTF